MKNKRLITLRARNGLTQDALGKAVGVSKQQISRIELNQQHGSTKTLKKLADFFGVSVDCLLNADDEIAKITD